MTVPDGTPFDPPGHIDHTVEDASTQVLHLHGEHDLLSSPQLLEAIEHAIVAGDIVVDLNAATFLDSSAIHAILRGQRAAHAAGRAYTIRVADDHALHRVLVLCGIDDMTEPN